MRNMFAKKFSYNRGYRRYDFKRGRRARWLWWALPVLVAAALLLYQIPSIQRRVAWRLDVVSTYVRNVLQPVGAMPTAAPVAAVVVTQPDPTAIATVTPTPEPARATEMPTPTETRPSLTPTPLPPKVALAAPPFERQDANNCGPATLSMYLNFYGWQGDQYTISQELKPFDDDKNVNIDELVYFARNRAGWLNTEFRVGGNTDLLRRFLAAGLPVVIEETSILDQGYWPNDDRWAGHYLLITGYDDAAGHFITQDSYYGPDRPVTYAKLDSNWQAFNRVYLLVYPAQQDELVRSIVGADWDLDANREHALEQSRAETQSDPKNAFAWFNLGSNLVYFEKYYDAAQAYDTARKLELPQRMLRYQFGPFLSYFHTKRTDDLMALAEYSLKRTPSSEEALLWRGWAYYRQGKKTEAVDDFLEALNRHPNYGDALYALEFMKTH